MKRKIRIIINVLKNYNKYEKLLGSQVRIIKNNGLPKYDKFINKFGVIEDFEYLNIKKPFIVWFPKDKVSHCYEYDEIEVVKW